MTQICQYSINGSVVTEGEFFKRKIYQLNVAGIDHIIEPFLSEISRQHGQVEYKNDMGFSSVVVHNISKDLNHKIQSAMDQNRLVY